jgi:hemolysin-activating ACP:hemolysin acyltransferase
MAPPPDPKTPSPTAQPSPLPPDPRARADVVCRQLPRRFEALGIAVELLFRRPPFLNFKFGKVVSMLRGQILRGHYLIAYRGARPVGYSGWAECTQEIADRWLRDGYMPTYQECSGGECAMLITVVSTEVATTVALIRAMRQRYPNRRVYFKREYPDGTTRKAVAFNRSPEGQEAPPTAHGAS